MAQSKRHIISGLEAVIDSTYAATRSDVWVDLEDLPEALRQLRKIKGEPAHTPRVYSGKIDDSVCIVLE